MSDLLSHDMSLNLSQFQTGKPGAASERLQKQMGKDQSGKIDHAAKEFEAVFVAEMMKPMFEGIDTNGQFGGGKGEEVFRGMMLQEYGKLIAETGTIGIADQVKSAMIQMQSEADAMNSIQPGGDEVTALTE